MWAWSDTAGGHGQYTAGARRPHVHMDYTDFGAGFSLVGALRGVQSLSAWLSPPTRTPGLLIPQEVAVYAV